MLRTVTHFGKPGVCAADYTVGERGEKDGSLTRALPLFEIQLFNKREGSQPPDPPLDLLP